MDDFSNEMDPQKLMGELQKAFGDGEKLIELMKRLNCDESEITERLLKALDKEDGETLLLVAIKGNHLPLVKLTVEIFEMDIFELGRFSWNGMEYLEAPPLFAAVISDQTPCFEIIEYLVDQSSTNESLAALDSVVQSKSNSRSQKIDMLELMGAAYILKNYGVQAMEFGLRCWKHAMALRQSSDDGELPIPKIPLQLCERAQKVFGNTSEIMTLEQLEELTTISTADPKNFKVFLLRETEAIFTVRRTMNKFNPDPHPLFPQYFEYYLKHKFQVQDTLSYSRMIDGFMLVLEPFEATGWGNAAEDWTYGIAWRIFMFMSTYFHEMDQLSPNHPDREEFTFDNVVRAMRNACAYVDKRRNVEHKLGTFRQSLMNEFFQVVPLLVKMLKEFIKHPTEEIKKSLSQYVQHTKENPGVRTLLHLLVCICQEIPIDVLQLLLEAGVNPNATDWRGDTPLHYLAHNWHCGNVDVAAKVLIDAGGHLDQANSLGEPALEFFKQMEKKNLDLRPNQKYGSLHPLINTVLPLTCQCAQLIRQENIPFEIAELPKSVQGFVKSHGFKGEPKTLQRCRCNGH